MSNVNKNKVLFVITKGSPFGGAQRYVYDLATNTPEDFEAIVACGDGESLPNALAEKGIRVIQIPDLERDINFSKEWKALKALLKIIKEERPDVLHLNSSKIGGLGALAGRIMGVPKIIFTGHGWAFNENRSQISKTLILFLHWLTIIFTHVTIAVSQKAKKDIVWLPFIKNKIKVIYNGIDKFKLRSKKDARHILTGEENSKKIIILSVSELHSNKGIDIALRGLARLPEKLKEKILYCISGEGGVREKLEKLAKDLGVKEMTRFLGFVPNAKELLAGADIFLLPSRTEAFPYVLLEAGGAGRAVIATRVGGVPEIIKDMQNGILIHPRSPGEVAEAIDYLILNPVKIKAFKERIKETVTDIFSISRMLDQTYSLYKSLLPNT